MPRLHRLLPGALALALVASPATVLSGQGVRFTLAPSAEYIWWDEAHQGISFFDQNRLAGGLRWTF